MLDQAGNVTAVAITGKDGTYWFDNLLDGEGLVSTTTRREGLFVPTPKAS